MKWFWGIVTASVIIWGGISFAAPEWEQVLGTGFLEEQTLVLVYQKDCRLCEVQFAQIPCFKEKYKSIRLLGIGKDRLALKKIGLRFSLPHNIISFRDAQALNIVGTPTLLWKEQGHWISTYGYQACKS